MSYARLNCQWLSWENRNGISKEGAQVLIWFMKTKEWKTMDLYWLNCTPSKSPLSATSWAILWWRCTKLFILSDVRVNKIINTKKKCVYVSSISCLNIQRDFPKILLKKFMTVSEKLFFFIEPIWRESIESTTFWVYNLLHNIT